MAQQPVQETRVQPLNGRPVRNGGYVLYWMQQSQRAVCNHALEYAIAQANALDQRLLVGFGLTDGYPEANLRHYRFMLEGLRETRTALADRGIRLVVRRRPPPDVALDLGRKASVIVCDRGYLRHQKQWRTQVARHADCRVVQVETDVIVPVEVVSHKAEYAARTIRPKIQRHLNDYLVGLAPCGIGRPSLDLTVRGMNLESIGAVLGRLSIDRSVAPAGRFFKGGAREGAIRLQRFIADRFSRYAANRNQPKTDDISGMSPYLHFGQISALEIALEIQAAGSRLKEARATYLEELIVRRELAANFVHYTPDYDRLTCLPGWAEKTLAEHRKDQRQYRYSRSQLENAQTHDPYWNAAMEEMKATGFMHNHMRMYWGKKILEWCETPEKAYETTLAINNKFFLDGRDPNSYAGVGWIFGLHDRAWFERPVFGKVRYMAATGLERKCDINGYLQKVAALKKQQ